MPTIEYKGKKIEIDHEGFLLDLNDWSRELATYLAELDGIDLDEDRWWFITFLRDYYEKHSTYPHIRTVTSNAGLELGREKGSVKFMWDKFPGGGLMICRFAGLPRPSG